MRAERDVSTANPTESFLVTLARSFGFEKYWERKKLDYAQAGRKLDIVSGMQDMGDWILSDPTITNFAECAEYVAYSTAAGDQGLFKHESEHTSFQIVTPSGLIRLSHGRLHQLLMRDPTDQFDLPEHLTWQMNLAIDHTNISPEATGILGETVVPTVDGDGNPIMQGMEVIRGKQADCEFDRYCRHKDEYDKDYFEGDTTSWRATVLINRICVLATKPTIESISRHIPSSTDHHLAVRRLA